MMAIDTSALLAIVVDEPKAAACIEALSEERELLISAGMVAEALIVAGRRDAKAGLDVLLTPLGVEIVPVTQASARRVADAYARWGKGVHPAGLNFGDCFAYDVAKNQGCSLLFVGNDFAKTDVESAL